MAVIDGVFCLDERVIYKSETQSVVTLEWSEIMGSYNTPENIASDRITYVQVMKRVLDWEWKVCCYSAVFLLVVCRRPRAVSV